MFLAGPLQHPATHAKGSLRALTIAFRPSSMPTDFGAIMTGISGVSSNSYTSPLQRLQDELTSEVNSGAVSSSDQSALSSALTDIDSSLQSGDPSGSGSSTSAAPR